MRKFLVLLDDSRECLNAMRFAAMRASNSGGAVTVLAVIPPNEIQHGFGVADVMRAEAQEKIEAHFQIFKDRMEKHEGVTPTLAVREGDKRIILIDGEPVRFANPRQAMEKGIGMVLQEQSLILNLTVMENIFLGREG